MAGRVYWGTQAWQADTDNPPEPTLLLIGDSWFWYPFNNLAGEIAAQLKDSHCLLVIGRNGAEAQQWSAGRLRRDIDEAFGWFGAGARALLLSGGGNDIAGLDDFGEILADDCRAAQTIADCYTPGQPDATLCKVQAAYREVIARFRRYNAEAPVLCHNYENAWPTGQGLFGPSKWLKAPMDQAGVPDTLRRPVFADLIARLHQLQQELADDPQTGAIVPIRSAGTLPDQLDVWANELHLTPAAFDKMVKDAWMPALKKLGIR
ncbi:hypothetical protein [Chitinimonas koreensis]|uniref:hypothetical protein n=1 Tax=Chitinimonas koreensis TaxID=356302 RepID=UPI00040A8A96|nr:hypothetical protein [Chitinimonas koreensis]QNM95728.1 hypothetical protein H9L41_18030 [Chitinimonas koreensis]